MPNNSLSMIGFNIDNVKPLLDSHYETTVNELSEDWKNRGLLRKIFELEKLDKELKLSFNYFDLYLSTKRRLLLLDGELVVQMSFVFSENDDIRSLVDFYINKDGMIRVNDPLTGVLLDYNSINSLPYAIFEQIASSAIASKLISI